jgi:hypothetical protein
LEVQHFGHTAILLGRRRRARLSESLCCGSGVIVPPSLP